MSRSPIRATRIIPLDYPDDFIECRVSGHEWRKSPTGLIPDFIVAPRGHGFYRVCHQCGVWRCRSYDTRGLLVWSSMRYPPDYLLIGAGYPEDRPKRAEWVLFAIERELS